MSDVTITHNKPFRAEDPPGMKPEPLLDENGNPVQEVFDGTTGKPKAQLEAAAQALPPQPASGGDSIGHPAVLVVKVPGDDGSEQIQVACVNGLDPLAAPSLLKLAVKLQEQKIGL